jgi:hypothetical protein
VVSPFKSSLGIKIGLSPRFIRLTAHFNEVEVKVEVKGKRKKKS